MPRWKLVFDCACIAATWFIWLPMLLFIGIAIKILSSGPVFYRQPRIGHKGRVFMIYKFRSMKMNAETRSHEELLERLMREERPMTKLDVTGDPRLIPLGHFLRASGLDELPQIFNILRGEMSIVGPRPCTVHEFEQYQPWQRARANALPGLTGLWQVNGKNKTTFNEMIAMDIQYINESSLALDLKILGKTGPAVFMQVMESWISRPRRGEQAVVGATIPDKA